jgi:hypothetical protein
LTISKWLAAPARDLASNFFFSKARASNMTTSPCIGLCRLDSATEVCVGCGRTIAEIVTWPDLSEAERAKIVARLKAPPVEPHKVD